MIGISHSRVVTTLFVGVGVVGKGYVVVGVVIIRPWVINDWILTQWGHCYQLDLVHSIHPIVITPKLLNPFLALPLSTSLLT